MRTPHNERLGSDNPATATARPHTPERNRDSRAQRAEPERKCVLSGVHGPREALIRLAIAPDGQVLPDIQARAPGRGAWIAVDRPALEQAIAKGKLRGALARAFKGAALTIPDDLPARIASALQRALTERLGLELRTGNLLMGSDRIADAARAGKVAWLAHAADAGEDGSRKLDQAWRVGEDAEGSGRAGARLPLDRAALSVALGRDNVVHLALTDSAGAQRVAAPLQRLLHFLGRAEANGHDKCDRTAAADPAMTTDQD
ncbi:MAG: DUF448 domain-containing protein [Novosphingobium sp.]|nr:DUF448 domain-containing protein [Novosphingobium sp.]